ncbi:MAG: type II and III secretion system protein [Acidobacteria bacterium]|nr:MAG: type II and III secretion system protein [Acidobacteriota bacterium]PYU72858.1 MAG: type II and III secretion system protein [Acidobacteriota bacterium]
MRRWGSLFLCVGLGLLAVGCPKGQPDYNQGRKAETLQDYDAAFAFYQKAAKADPYNATYKIKLNRVRFEASELHVKRGVELRKQGDLQGAAGEFQRAQAMDPSSPVADQELRKTVEMIAEKNRAADAAAELPTDPNEPPLAAMPPEIKPLSRAPINLKMSNDAKIVFDTIGKLAGLTVIYDPDFPARRITVELNNVTMEQALEIVSLETKAFVKPVTENIIFVIPDQPQKRRDYEEQVVKTFYVSNTVQPQDLTEIVTGLRQLLDLKRIQQLNSQNAIIVRDTPDKLLLAEKMIRDIDKAKPEVVVQVEVLEARTDRLRDLGILPGQTASIAINPNSSTTSSSSGTTSTTSNSGITLNQLRHLNGSDLVFTLPSATANAILSDTSTRIIQNPEVRSVDGQTAKLRIGDRIPIATGSFQAGVGVGSTGGAGFVNPLVNTQFTYLDVGVNIDLTPRVHPNRDVSLKLKVEVSSHTGDQAIGGITQPIISQRVIEHDIRLKEGEVSILGGLVQRTNSKTLEGWPGLAKLPLLRYLFSHDKTDHQEDEVLIVLTPRIVRIPEWTKANLRTMYAGSDTNVQVKRESEIRAPAQQPASSPQPKTNQNTGAGTPTSAPSATAPAAGTAQGAPAAKIRFEPQSLSLKAGQTATIGVVVDNVSDLFSIPLLLQYNPAVISVEEVQHGGFLSGGTQEIAIVQQVFKEKGQAIISATRQPNTPGVSGSGTLIGIVVKALAPGSSNLSIVQVNAKDSEQKLIPLITQEATLQVQQ